ncbi:glycosyltransferase [Vibrio owensii]|uniref:glycosyltransferase n=1 Tax=Vibrio owensii TaxID=696485 RepID=UPI003391EF0A
MKKIAILVNSAANGGGEKIAVEMANYISKETKYEVDLILIEDDVKYNINSSVKLIHFDRNNRLPGFISRLCSFFQVFFFLTRSRYDVVISHLYVSNYLNALVRCFSRYVSIGVTHGSINKYKRLTFKNLVNKIAIKCLFGKLDHKVFLTEGMCEDFYSLIGISDNNSCVIPNGYRFDNIYDMSLETRISIPYKKDDYFVFIGRAHEVKKIDNIISACIAAHKNLVIVGDGPLLKQLTELANKSTFIHFCGQVPNPFPILKDSKALILASETEGFPNVIIEALALQVPVISSDCRTGPREIIGIEQACSFGDIVHNKKGILFSVGDEVALENILENFSDYEFDKEDMLSTAKTYSLESMCKKYEEIMK